MRGPNAELAVVVVVGRQASAVERVGPLVVVGAHGSFARAPHRLAQRAARIDVGGDRGGDPIVLHAHGRVHGAQEALGVGVTVDRDERRPQRRLVLDLAQRVLAEVVGQTHAVVAEAATHAHAARYLDADGTAARPHRVPFAQLHERRGSRCGGGGGDRLVVMRPGRAATLARLGCVGVACSTVSHRYKQE